MKNPDYNRLLDLSLEIEGLIMLLQQRDDSCPAEAKDLLCKKISELNSLANPGEAMPEEPEVVIDDNDLVDPVVVNDLPEIDDMPDFSEPEPPVCMPPAEDTGPEIATEADEEIVQSTLFEQAEDAGGNIRLDQKLARDSVRDIHRAFTINDRYRFRRELFSNSESRLNDALDLIAAMNSLDEAEEYFYNDLAWDRESQDVIDFMDIVAKHFDANVR